MAVRDAEIADRYALYNGDCVEVMKTLPDNCVHLSLYSPPFAGLYVYSSDEHDLSNSVDYDEFMEHYGYVVSEISRLTLPGRMSAVHCMDLTTGNTGCDHLLDFPGEIIRLHKKCGLDYVARYHIWKEPLTVRNRTMMKSLSHKQLCRDSTRCSVANADYLLIFRNKGENQIPVVHPTGLLKYAGERTVPEELLRLRGMSGDQKKNRYSHWIWRQYASAFWDDVRLDRTLPHREGKDPEDEKHVHPLQLDVIERACELWSNPGEVVLSPFSGVGSEVYGAVICGRKAIGIELKPSYHRQAVRNCRNAKTTGEAASLFADTLDIFSEDKHDA